MVIDYPNGDFYGGKNGKTVHFCSGFALLATSIAQAQETRGIAKFLDNISMFRIYPGQSQRREKQTSEISDREKHSAPTPL